MGDVGSSMANKADVSDAITGPLLRIVPRLSRVMEREMLRSGVSLSLRQLRVLQRLHDGEQIAADIARDSSVGPAAMQGVVDGLVDRGLVDRQRSPLDRRKQLLQLTPEGATALDTGTKVLTAALGAIVEDLPVPQQRSLASALGSFQVALDRHVAANRVPTPSG